MAHIVEDRVLESTTTTGTGAITLAAAVTGFRRFSAVCAVADTVDYFIEAIDSTGLPTGDYEYGLGTYSAANTLARTTVRGSSNAGAAVNFAAGSKNVGIGLQAANFARSLAANGYTKLPGGVILQWGQADMGAGSSVAVVFPLAFPTACRSVVATDLGSNLAIGTVAPATTTGVTFSSSSTPGVFNWFAIGH